MAAYFVTGASGFIGQALLRELSIRGHKIFALSRRQGQKLHPHSQIEWIHADLLEVNSYRHALKAADFVIHLAGLLNARRKEEYDRTNVQGTLALLKACEKTSAPRKRFLHMSSIAVMGPRYDGNLLKESQSCRPATEYGKSKLKAERAAIRCSQSIPVVILRPSFVYGIGDLRALKAITAFIRQRDISWISFVGTVSLCYVSDLIGAILLSLEKDINSGEFFIISDPHPYTRNDIGKAILNSLSGLARFGPTKGSSYSSDRPATSIRDLAPRTMNRLQHWGCDITHAQDRLSFQPRVLLEEGAIRTIQWYFTKGLLDANFLKEANLLLQGLI